MKKLVLPFLLACTFLQAQAQRVPDYSPLKNGTKEQKIARANEVALQAATYLLSVPPDTNNTDVKDAGSYLMMWMTETPDYSFSLDEAISELYGGNTALLPVLLAAMVEYEIKNPAHKDDRFKVRLNAAKRLIAYASKPSNKVNPHDALKNAMKANEKGELEKYLASFDKE